MQASRAVFASLKLIKLNIALLFPGMVSNILNGGSPCEANVTRGPNLLNFFSISLSSESLRLPTQTLKAGGNKLFAPASFKYVTNTEGSIGLPFALATFIA
jgi:hypothetical protein